MSASDTPTPAASPPKPAPRLALRAAQQTPGTSTARAPHRRGVFGVSAPKRWEDIDRSDPEPCRWGDFQGLPTAQGPAWLPNARPHTQPAQRCGFRRRHPPPDGPMPIWQTFNRTMRVDSSWLDMRPPRHQLRRPAITLDFLALPQVRALVRQPPAAKRWSTACLHPSAHRSDSPLLVLSRTSGGWRVWQKRAAPRLDRGAGGVVTPPGLFDV